MVLNSFPGHKDFNVRIASLLKAEYIDNLQRFVIFYRCNFVKCFVQLLLNRVMKYSEVKNQQESRGNQTVGCVSSHRQHYVSPTITWYARHSQREKYCHLTVRPHSMGAHASGVTQIYGSLLIGCAWQIWALIMVYLSAWCLTLR